MLTTLEPYLKVKPSSVSETDGFEEGDCVADGFGVAIKELYFFAGSFATRLHAGLSAPHHDDVVAQAHEAIEYLFPRELAVAEQKDDGDEAPDDSEHGKAGAETVADERLEGLRDDFEEVHGVRRWGLGNSGREADPPPLAKDDNEGLDERGGQSRAVGAMRAADQSTRRHSMGVRPAARMAG